MTEEMLQTWVALVSLSVRDHKVEKERGRQGPGQCGDSAGIIIIYFQVI